jgi:GTPase
MTHKAGFVNIIGNPNVGKSTLMNAFVGEKISIITTKAQTTRQRVMGIVNSDDFQIVYSDTPGLLNPKYKLQETMLKFATSALIDADILLYVTDVNEKAALDESIHKRIKNFKSPILLLINKLDLSNQERVTLLIDDWQKLLPGAEIIPVSAKAKFNLETVLTRIMELLPEGPPYYPKDALTDRNERFFVSEIIREKILLYYQKEIPYSVEVQVEQFKEEEKIIKINCLIITERESQKMIIIGDKGKALKKVGTEARKDMESFLGKKVYLQLFVKVDKDWRNNINSLKNFGYTI